MTGGTGFIGAHFINAAMQTGHDVIALKRPGSHPRIQLLKDPKWIEGQLNGNYEDSFNDCDLFVHFASAGVSPQETTWEHCFTQNVVDSILIWEKAIDAGIDKLVIAGTCSEYGMSGLRYDAIPPNAPLEPVGAYASSKAASFIAAHGLAIDRKIKLAYLRISSAFGEGQYEKNLWPSLRRAAFKGADFPMTAGEQVRDFISVENVADQFINIIDDIDGIDPGKPIIRNVGTGTPQTVREFSEYWWSYWVSKGTLLPGAIPYREDEVMRFVPEV